MCGIVGIYSKIGLTDEDLSKFSAMLERCQKRGYDATGVLNSDMRMLKAALPSRIFVTSQKYRDFIISSVGNKFIIGHCRSATRGLPKENKNNHPIQVPFENEKILLVHNGIVECEKWDKDEFKGNKGMEMVDTYVFSNAINQYCNEIGTDDLFRIVKLAFEDVHKSSKVNESVIVVASTKEIVLCKSTAKPMIIQALSNGEKVLFGSEEDIIDLEANARMKEKGTPIMTYFVLQDHSIVSLDVENGDRIECLLETLPDPKPTLEYYRIDHRKQNKGSENKEKKNMQDIDDLLGARDEWKERKKRNKNRKEKERKERREFADEFGFGEISTDEFGNEKNCRDCLNSKGRANFVDDNGNLIETTRCCYYGIDVNVEDAKKCHYFIPEIHY